MCPFFLFFAAANPIGDAGARALAKALQKNSSLTQMNLSGAMRNAFMVQCLDVDVDVG